MKGRNSELECLEHKFRDVVVENLAIKEEVGVLKKKYDELEKRILENGNENRGKEDVEEKLLKLMAENKLLECEKRKAESEVEVWKAKFEVLKLRVKELEGRDKDCILVGKVSEIEIPETGNMDASAVGGLKEGSSVLKGCTHLQAERTVSNSGERMHSVAGVITSAQPTIEATKIFYVSEDTLTAETPHKHLMHGELAEQSSLPGPGAVYGSQLRKQLTHGEGSPSKKMAPSTPGGSKCATINEDMIGDKGNSPLNATRKRRRASNIVNSDSEDEDILLSALNVDVDTQPESITDFQLNSSPVHGTDLGNIVHKTASKRRLVTLGNAASTPKRKEESNIVYNDTASEDDDDDVPISQLVTNVSSVSAGVSENRAPESLSRRRLASLRKFSDKWLQQSSNTKSNLNAMEKNYHPGNLKEDDGEDASTEENESESGDESMEDFIDDRTDISEKSDSDDSLSIKSDSGNSLSRNSNDGEASGDSENTSCDGIDYEEIMSKLGRKRDSHTSKWKFEAEMLADFGKDPEMCMKAVCALYRQQTIDEQSAKGALYRNNRGFSLCDAYRGTSLAEFLTDGSGGELRKSVEELKQYSAKGIELCRELAKRYSKQLFAIYKNKEDPFFLPDKIRD